MNTTGWNDCNVRENMNAGPQEFERLIEALNLAEVDDDFDLGEPWISDTDSLDDDPE